MLKIGITGGIGSGKTTVCEVWASLGAYIINADDVAKHIMISNEAVKKEIIVTFGAASYQPDGSLNKPYLAQEAFGKERVEELNAIVHPRVPAEVECLMDKAETQGMDTMVYEAALLLQNVRPHDLDVIVLVLAQEDKRIKRVQQRDESSRKLVMDRINKQQNFEELIPQADFIIHNNNSLNELKEKGKSLYQKIRTAKKD